MSLANNLLDHLKFYINPRMYQAEKEIDNKEYRQVNAVFAEQSRIGRATGKLSSPKIVKDALERIKAEKNKGLQKEKRKRIVVTTSESGALKEEVIEDFYAEDEEVLG